MNERKFAIGQLVMNFGSVCRVIGYEDHGGYGKEDLIVIGHGLQVGGMKWLADPDKCEPFSELVTEAVLVHKNQLAY